MIPIANCCYDSSYLDCPLTTFLYCLHGLWGPLWPWSYVQSVLFTTKVVSLNPADGEEVYSMQHYMIKFVSDLRQVCGFLQVLFVCPYDQWNWPPQYNWNIVESDVMLVICFILKQCRQNPFLNMWIVNISTFIVTMYLKGLQIRNGTCSKSIYPVKTTFFDSSFSW